MLSRDGLRLRTRVAYVHCVWILWMLLLLLGAVIIFKPSAQVVCSHLNSKPETGPVSSVHSSVEPYVQVITELVGILPNRRIKIIKLMLKTETLTRTSDFIGQQREALKNKKYNNQWQFTDLAQKEDRKKMYMYAICLNITPNKTILVSIRIFLNIPTPCKLFNIFTT